MSQFLKNNFNVLSSSSSSIPTGDPLILLMIPSSSSSIPLRLSLIHLGQNLEEDQEKVVEKD